MSNLLDKYSETRLLDQMVVLFLTFWEASILFREYLPEVKVLCIENDKILIKQCKKDTSRKIFHFHELEDLILLSSQFYPKKYTDSISLYQNSNGTFYRNRKKNSTMHMKPQKTTSCQIYAEKEQNWKHHTFCFLTILKSNSNVCFEKKIHRNHRGLNARSASVRRKEEGWGKRTMKGGFQGSSVSRPPHRFSTKANLKKLSLLGNKFSGWHNVCVCVCVCVCVYSFILWKQERIPSLLWFQERRS